MLKCSTNATFNAKMNNTPRKIYINSYIVQGAQTLPRFFFPMGVRFVLDWYLYLYTLVLCCSAVHTLHAQATTVNPLSLCNLFASSESSWRRLLKFSRLRQESTQVSTPICLPRSALLLRSLNLLPVRCGANTNCHEPEDNGANWTKPMIVWGIFDGFCMTSHLVREVLLVGGASSPWLARPSKFGGGGELWCPRKPSPAADELRGERWLRRRQPVDLTTAAIDLPPKAGWQRGRGRGEPARRPHKPLRPPRGSPHWPGRADAGQLAASRHEPFCYFGMAMVGNFSRNLGVNW
jgi:hypothetical protein